jgi:hypothetical protein|tara:strand:- start:497 stop:730 length:234 start_codon:yes stop_codon:yes gene_type:complete
MFNHKVKVTNPFVLIRENFSEVDFMFRAEQVDGEFYLVKASTAKEIRYLQLLDKNISVFIPYEGEGLLVRAKDIDYL